MDFLLPSATSSRYGDVTFFPKLIVYFVLLLHVADLYLFLFESELAFLSRIRGSYLVKNSFFCIVA